MKQPKHPPRPRGVCHTPSYAASVRQPVYQSFNGFVGECFECFAKFPVCWQFCWQFALGPSQPIDAQASKLEPVVGLEPTTDGLQNRCSTTELNWHHTLNHQLELMIFAGVGEVPDSIYMPVFGRFCSPERAAPSSTERGPFWEGPTRWQVNSPPPTHT